MLTAGRERVGARGADRPDRAARGDGPRTCRSPTGSSTRSAFTYLLRYVDDVPATLRELVRVVRPGGTVAMLEFGLPRGVWRPLWELYVRVGLPAAGAVVSPGWGGVGRFLGPSIRGFWRDWPEPRLLDAWREAGLVEVARSTDERRRRSRRLGKARLTAARPRPAFYALAPRRLARLRDAAPSAVHALAPLVRRCRRGARAADGLAAARLDGARLRARDGSRGARARRAARHGRSRPASPSRVLVALAAVSISAAAAIGIAVAVSRTLWLLVVRRRRGVPRRRLQPRAVRREVPRRALVRGGLGGVPGADRLFRVGRDAARQLPLPLRSMPLP